MYPLSTIILLYGRIQIEDLRLILYLGITKIYFAVKLIEGIRPFVFPPQYYEEIYSCSLLLFVIVFCLKHEAAITSLPLMGI